MEKKKISSEILLNHTGLRSIMSRVITLDCKQQGPYIAGQHAVIHCTVASVSRGILKPPSRSCSDTFTITHTQSAGYPPDPALHSEWWSWPRLPCCTASRTSAGPSWWSSCGPVGSPPRCKADDWKRVVVLVMNREQVIGPSWPLAWTKPT